MPRRSKGARLWLRNAQYNTAGKLTHAAVWIIKDGDHRESTGCGADDRGGAERALEIYLNRKYSAAAFDGVRAPAAIPIADVIALYARDKAPNHARPKETGQRLKSLLKFFGDKMLSEINGDLCRKYARERGAVQAARKELEDLRAAINHHRREGLCNAIVEVVLPPKSAPRERWLTRAEAARLIWAAWRYRETQKGMPTDKHPRRHVAKFLLVALYSATRKTAICEAALEPTVGRPFIDLDRGVFYRRPQGGRQTKKRRPPVPLPERLLAHLRRWRRRGQRFVIEWKGQPVGSIDKAFERNVEAAKLGSDVTPHTTRHTSVTWLAQAGVDPWEICKFAGITMEVFEEVYAHHHPDYMDGVRDGFSRHRNRHRNAATKREQTTMNVTKILDFSKTGTEET